MVKLFGPHVIEPQVLDVASGNEQTLKASAIFGCQGRDDFLRDLLGRNQFPNVDRVVFIFVQRPANAVAVEPTVLVGLAVVVGVDVAIHFQTIAIVAPYVDDVIAIGIGELPQDFVIYAADDPRSNTVDFFRFDRTFGDLSLGGRVIFYVLLHGSELQRITHRRGCLGR